MRRLCLLLAALLLPTTAWAETPASAPASAPAKKKPRPRQVVTGPVDAEGTYDGVVLDHPEAEPSRPGGKRPDGNVVTWVGFKKQGKLPRVFVQLSAPAHFSQAVAGKDLVVSIPAFKLGTPNNARSLDTRFFKTEIASVTASQVKDDVLIRVRFTGGARQATATVTEGVDGTILSLDFPPKE
jgi:hypothetical protein